MFRRRTWLGRPLWEMHPAEADVYFGKVLREAVKDTRLSRAQAIKTYYLYLELRHKVEIHAPTRSSAPIWSHQAGRSGSEHPA